MFSYYNAPDNFCITFFVFLLRHFPDGYTSAESLFWRFQFLARILGSLFYFPIYHTFSLLTVVVSPFFFLTFLNIIYLDTVIYVLRLLPAQREVNTNNLGLISNLFYRFLFSVLTHILLIFFFAKCKKQYV